MEDALPIGVEQGGKGNASALFADRHPTERRLGGSHDIISSIARLIPNRPRAAKLYRRSGTVWATITFSQGLFGKPANPTTSKVLRDLSLWDKDSKIITLSGGMKRRVMICQACRTKPQILDELRRASRVELKGHVADGCACCRENSVTIILTTHYIQGEEMADRISDRKQRIASLVEESRAHALSLGKKA